MAFRYVPETRQFEFADAQKIMVDKTPVQMPRMEVERIKTVAVSTRDTAMESTR